jgi:GNAT superfamily N-acetyltransferase
MAPRDPRFEHIVHAQSAIDMNQAKSLFQEYADSLNISLCFQNFEQELRDLPGEYRAPCGRLLLARVQNKPAGCVAVRPLNRLACEMKRLFVRPPFRGQGLGRDLALCAICEARRIGYHCMRLDTLPSMREAMGLYRVLGFRDISRYTVNPVPGAHFMELDLTGALP